MPNSITFFMDTIYNPKLPFILLASGASYFFYNLFV